MRVRVRARVRARARVSVSVSVRVRIAPLSSEREGAPTLGAWQQTDRRPAQRLQVRSAEMR